MIFYPWMDGNASGKLIVNAPEIGAVSGPAAPYTFTIISGGGGDKDFVVRGCMPSMARIIYFWKSRPCRPGRALGGKKASLFSLPPRSASDVRGFVSRRTQIKK